MSEEKKGSVTQLNTPFRHATPDMLEQAERLEALAAKIRAGSVCAVALAYVEEVNPTDTYVYKHWNVECRRYSLIGAVSTLRTHIEMEAMRSERDV